MATDKVRDSQLLTVFLLTGKVLVSAEYGWCSRGFAMRAKGLGARVVITEVDHLKSIEVAII